MYFYGFRGPELLTDEDGVVAPKETFNRFQLAAISAIFMDYTGFP